MSFRITGLSVHPFTHLFDMSDVELATHGVQRFRGAGLPDRVELRDTTADESALLLNHEHQPANTPYRSRHAIFVREHAGATFDAVGEVPEALRSRLLSLRAFDAGHQMVDADVVDGTAVETLIARLLALPEVDYIQAHFARRGCYAALIRRA